MELTIQRKPAGNAPIEGPEPGAHEAFLVMNDDPYMHDFLRFAIRRGLEAAESYANAARIVIWENQKTFFSDMAALKRADIERLRRYHFDGRFSVLERDNHPSIGTVTMYMLDLEMNPIGSMEDACRFALKRELNDLQMYIRLAELEEDPLTKGLFCFLVELQKSHLHYVQNQLIIAKEEPAERDACSPVTDW